MNQVSMNQKVGVELVPAQLTPRGRFVVEHWRAGKKINEYVFSNAIVNQGKNKLLDVMFHAVAAVTTWYVGLIDYAGYTALAATDTYQLINTTNGWDEFTDYTDAGNSDSASTRPVWTEGAAAAQAITNASPLIYDITDTGTVKGVFVVGGIANAVNKDDVAASGVLWATALFGADVPVASSDQLKITYTVTA